MIGVIVRLKSRSRVTPLACRDQSARRRLEMVSTNACLRERSAVVAKVPELLVGKLLMSKKESMRGGGGCQP